MNFLEWNDAIGAHFFNPTRSDARVFLYASIDIINEVGAPNESDLADFITAVKTGPPWITRHGQSVCQQALQALKEWRSRGLKCPPYLAYLALFVLADTVKVDGFARYSYYPGLRQLLGEEPAAGGYPSFDKMYELWFDLEEWSNEDMGGSWGVFRADILGKRQYVGLPKAQTILTDDERSKLPLLFADAGFDPSSPPTDAELAYLLSRETHHYLLPHTKQLLDPHSGNSQPIRDVLIDAIVEELQNWDGSVPPQTELGEQIRSSLGNLRLVMILDLTNRTVRFFLRCRSGREYPDEGLQLTGSSMRAPLYCFEDWQGWSTPLSIDENQTRSFDASKLDWRIGLSLDDNEHAWRVALSKRSLRIMTSATPLGFDGFVEENQIPTRKAFYLLSHDSHSQMLHRWGVQCCEGFSRVDLISGLPDRWNLYSIERADSDALIRDTLPFLAFPVALRIQLRGGLKVRGNQYFVFALPDVEITGSTDQTDIYCNDHRLSADMDTGLYVIPDTLNARKLVIEARQDGECVRRRSLYAVEGHDGPEIFPRIRLDRFGFSDADSGSEACVGPITRGFTPPDFNPEILLPPGAGHRVYFIGRNPGEIVEYPNQKISNNWKPVWAVCMKKRRKGTAIYCGTDLENDVPGTAKCTDRRRLRLWKELLWYKRKQILVPSHKRIRALWTNFRKVAHRVH